MKMSTDRKDWKAKIKAIVCCSGRGKQEYEGLVKSGLQNMGTFLGINEKGRRGTQSTNREKLPLAVRQLPVIRTIPKGQPQIYKLRVHRPN